MLRYIITAFIALTLFSQCTKAPLPAPTYSFNIIEDNFESAKTLAAAQNKNIFLMVHADWCSICQNFKSSVLTDAQIKTLLEGKIVVALVDGDKTYGKPYANQYGVTGFPTFLICDANGNEISRKKGALDKTTFSNWVTPFLR